MASEKAAYRTQEKIPSHRTIRLASPMLMPQQANCSPAEHKNLAESDYGVENGLTAESLMARPVYWVAEWVTPIAAKPVSTGSSDNLSDHQSPFPRVS
jgi:hypothetical protein